MGSPLPRTSSVSTRQQLGWSSRERPVLFWHLVLRRVPSGPERRVSHPVRQRHHLGRVFPSFAVPVCLGAAGRRVSLARCADDPGSPVGTALALGGPPQDGGTAGCVDVGPSPRRVLALRDGGGVRSAGRDCQRLNPLLRKKGHHIHTQTPAHPERAARTSTCHSRHAPGVARASPWRCAMCRYVYAWCAQQCTAQWSANDA